MKNGEQGIVKAGVGNLQAFDIPSNNLDGLDGKKGNGGDSVTKGNVKHAKNTRLTPRGRPFLPGNPGRPKGSVNRFTNLRKAFLAAFEAIGGQEALGKWAKQKENRADFYRLLAKMLPRDIEVFNEGDREPIKLIVIYPAVGDGSRDELISGN
jgi:hypothetical protein